MSVTILMINYACDSDFGSLIQRLEHKSMLAIEWLGSKLYEIK